ncbi:hypothetical protein KUTeg_022670 [Tegillarca granosa]|uniref:Uncharacterized protein n=1 Tax=Tegillarca granosa TaxID=220873 RepID=A0ABQ9E0B9_TEGGR|nr:hypothetical protein KUTeg_022670 [Tegillarca granosa]
MKKAGFTFNLNYPSCLELGFYMSFENPLTSPPHQRSKEDNSCLFPQKLPQETQASSGGPSL